MNPGKKSVVLVDDENHIRLLIKMAVNTMGCEVVAEGKNGNEAIQLYREKRPDLLLLDINMPEKSGEEALREIVGEFPQALVVMLTSVSDLATVENCLVAGAANYIRKDTPLAEIKLILGEILAG